MDTHNLDEQFQLAFGELQGRLDYAELLLLNAIQQLSEEGKSALRSKQQAIFNELRSQYPASSKVPFHRAYLRAVAASHRNASS